MTKPTPDPDDLGGRQAGSLTPPVPYEPGERPEPATENGFRVTADLRATPARPAPEQAGHPTLPESEPDSGLRSDPAGAPIPDLGPRSDALATDAEAQAGANPSGDSQAGAGTPGGAEASATTGAVADSEAQAGGTAGTSTAPVGGSAARSAGDGDSAIQAVWREFRERPEQRLRERLVLHYAPLVKYVAGRVGTGLPTHVDVSDLIQSGIFGLIDAIEKFEPERGLRFETYAMQRIRGAILDDLRSQDWVPRVVRSRAREVERALERLGGRLRRTPTDTEVAAELGITLDELRDLYSQLQLTSVVALEDLMAAGRESGSLVDTLPDDDAIDPVAVLVDRDNRRQLAEAIAQLTERDRIVVSLYYFERLTLAEIGRVLGVTESRVSQLHTRAVLRLRARLTEQAGV